MTAPPPTPRWPARTAVTGFLVCAAAAIAFAVVYASSGNPQVEGALLGVAMAGLGIGLVVWAHQLLPRGPYAEPRPELASERSEQALVEADFERGGMITRRRVLLGSLLTAAGGLAVAAVLPIRSLGPSPDRSLRHTQWRRGRALVNDQGQIVRASEVPTGGLVTAFPEGDPGSADGQIVLIRLERDVKAAGGATPEGFIAFSKICTHAGCPVGLYQAQLHQLLCPCHQSAFDVLQGAKPVFGPAARALPRLPIEVDEQGQLRALGDFPEPVGPAWWSR
jgi:ubiquinol-cytochrome c reductase iron-sulfur subunit